MNFKELLEIAKIGLVDLSNVDNPDFRLEQAEYIESTEVWEIVVSYLVENTNKKTSPIAALTPEFPYFRIYKKLKIDKNKNITGLYIFENKQ